jgi:protein-L-isoaspartate(D-aspartate) O-methyltransferase
MAHLVGPTGRITAIEFEPDLALRARQNLAESQNATAFEGDGSAVAFEPADVIYVNAGATRPAESWLDGLRDGGRLILPLTTDDGGRDPASFQRRGAVFLIRRQGAHFMARWISPVAIYPAVGARDPASEKALAEAFKKDDWRRVTRLYRNDALPPERCWLRAPGWSLAYE